MSGQKEHPKKPVPRYWGNPQAVTIREQLLRKSLQDDKTHIEHLRRTGRYIPREAEEPIEIERSVNPFYWMEKGLETVVHWLKTLALLEALELLGALGILIAAIVFVADEGKRRDAEVYEAWQVITAANTQTGSGGRIKALEFLNSQPRRNPWFWLRWPRESLQGLSAPKAYLQGIKLKGADLQGADLQGADLGSADLQGANLGWADLQGAAYFDDEIFCPELFERECSTTLPDDLAPKERGMDLIESDEEYEAFWEAREARLEALEEEKQENQNRQPVRSLFVPSH